MPVEQRPGGDRLGAPCEVAVLVHRPSPGAHFRHPRSLVMSDCGAPQLPSMEVTSPESIAAAVEVLRRGGLLGLPTETVYGLAADAENELAVRKIFAVKGRPEWHPLIVHLSGVEALDGWVRDMSPFARAVADAFWPGPLTIVMKRGPRALDVVTGGQDTVAIRVPSHPLAHELLRRFGGGVAAPSANRFGKVSPTRAEHVRTDLGDDVDLVLD